MQNSKDSLTQRKPLYQSPAGLENHSFNSQGQNNHIEYLDRKILDKPSGNDFDVEHFSQK